MVVVLLVLIALILTRQLKMQKEHTEETNAPVSGETDEKGETKDKPAEEKPAEDKPAENKESLDKTGEKEDTSETAPAPAEGTETPK